MIQELISQTPYFAEGFGGNLLMSVLAMSAGTLIGGILGCVRAGYGGLIALLAGFSTSICRNVPSFVLLFYMAFMIPNQITWSGEIVEVPVWFKATVALTFPVIGFASDQTVAFFGQYRDRVQRAGETFIVAWVQYLLIILMASAVASVIGADEIVGRANAYVARSNDPQFLLVTYGYVSIWFLGSGLLVTALMRGLLWARRR
ncbi:MAG: hypothetical protein AAF330_05605 [Pseudomonadota bacterium]